MLADATASLRAYRSARGCRLAAVPRDGLPIGWYLFAPPGIDHWAVAATPRPAESPPSIASSCHALATTTLTSFKRWSAINGWSAQRCWSFFISQPNTTISFIARSASITKRCSVRKGGVANARSPSRVSEAGLTLRTFLRQCDQRLLSCPERVPTQPIAGLRRCLRG